MGTTLKALQSGNEKMFERFALAAKSDPFIRYVLTNVDSSLASSDETSFKKYARLAGGVEHNEQFLNRILDELELTRRMIDKILQIPISERRENHYYSTLLRAEALEPLHTCQVDLLKRWRETSLLENSSEAEKILFDLLRSISAIADAIGFTG